LAVPEATVVVCVLVLCHDSIEVMDGEVGFVGVGVARCGAAFFEDCVIIIIPVFYFHLTIIKHEKKD